MTDNPLLDAINKEMERNELVLPTLPSVAIRIRDVVEDEMSTIQDIADVITTDPALSARILQIANNPHSKPAKPIVDVGVAVTRIGISVIPHLVTGLVMGQLFRSENKTIDRYLKNTWSNASKVATAAQGIATSLAPHLNNQVAFLAGLLHDIGNLPILTRASEMYGENVDVHSLDETLRSEHTRVGAELLKLWNFPEELVSVIANHENLHWDGGKKADYTDVIIAANYQMHVDKSVEFIDTGKIPAFVKLGIYTDMENIEIRS